MECVEFSENHILLGQFQWFIYIVSYLHFVTWETVLTVESQKDDVHDSKEKKRKEQSIFVSAFKIDVPPILGVLEEGGG